MMPRAASAAVRVLIALSLLVSWTTAGWAAACARVPESGAAQAVHAMAMHHGVHGTMHHPSPPPQRAPRGGDGAECPLLAMGGGSCIGAAHLPAIVSAAEVAFASADGYPPAAGVHDRLLAVSLFRPPKS